MTEIDVSDRSLRVFAAAVDAGSFTEAAARLGIGQPAVSHAVARLEDALARPLLVRSRTGVTPTAAGAELMTALGPAFASIDDAIERLRRGGAVGAVTLVVSTSFAAWWLLPRLPDFKRLHPEIELRLVTADSDGGVDVDGFDLWVPLGIVERPDLAATRLCDEEIVPVASPALSDRLRVREPADLAGAPLLHLEERYRPRFDWARWFAHHGVEAGEVVGDRSNDYSLVIQAALDGQGVALGWRHIVDGLIADGRLVALSDGVITDQPFAIHASRRRTLRPEASALREWLVSAMSGGPGQPGAG